MKRLATILLLAAALSSGCVEKNPRYNPDPLLPGECRRGIETSETFDNFEQPQKLDILAVVDNSGDIMREQDRLASALPGFLRELEGRGLSIRFGVVTTDAASDDGLAPPGTIRDGCEQNTGRIADSESGNQWRRMAACNVMQGDEGLARQQALEVIERAVIDRPGNLKTFFRDQSRILILVLSNEDDCSGDQQLGQDDAVRNLCVWNNDKLTPIEDMIEAVRSEASTPEGVSMAVLSGPPSAREVEDGEALRPVCQGTLGAAYPANRLYEASRLLGEQGYFQSLCTDDLSYGLGEIAGRLIGPSRATFCPARRLVHEPLEVTVPESGGETEELALGQDGFLYLGPTDECERGAVSVAPEALEEAIAVEMRYCVDPA